MEPQMVLVDGERVQVIGRAHVLVESRTTSDTWYAVEWDPEWNKWVCTCMGWEVRKTCRHSRAIDRFAAGLADVHALDKDGNPILEIGGV